MACKQRPRPIRPRARSPRRRRRCGRGGFRTSRARPAADRRAEAWPSSLRGASRGASDDRLSGGLSMLIALLIPLGLAFLVNAFVLLRAAIRARAIPKAEAIGLGAVVNFFDTLGIGSFALTTAWFKFRKMVPDRLIPP